MQGSVLITGRIIKIIFALRSPQLEIAILINSFSEYLLDAYYVLGIILCVVVKSVTKTL